MVKTQSQIKLNLGESAPNFSLKGVDGKFYSLEDFKNSKALLVVFMCNHCPYVLAKIEDLKNIAKEFKDKGVVLVGINSNDPDYPGEGFENMQRFAQEKNLNFPYLFDETQEVAKVYGASCTPDPFLFDENLKLVYHGRINDALNPDEIPKVQILKENIEKLLRGEKIEPWFLPSVGCSIKWRS